MITLPDQIRSIPPCMQASDRDRLLVNAALAAIEQWRFKATALNCGPVQVESPVHIDFSAAEGHVRL